MDRLFTICYLPTCLLVLGLVMNKTDHASKKLRIISAFVSFFVIMLVIPLVDVIFVRGRSEAPLGALVLVLVCCTLVGIFDGLSQGAIYSEAAHLPPKYTHAIIRGTASSGLIICLLRLATKATLPATPEGLRASTAIYFTLAAVISAACVVVYTVVMPRLPALQYYHEKAFGEPALQLSAHETEDEALLWSNAEAALHPPGDNPPKPHHLPISSSPSHLRTTTPTSPPLDDPFAPDPLVAPVQLDPDPHPSVWRIWSHNWQLSVALVALYAVTLSIFPGFLAEDVHSAALGSWYPELLITAFNIADLIGKNLPHTLLPLQPPAILGHSLARVLYIPLFILTAYYNLHPVSLMALTFALGVSNGYLTAVAMTVGAELAPKEEAAGSEGVLVFSLIAGLNVGAFAGWLWLL